MKVLLTAVNAKYIHSNPAVYSLRAYASQYEEQTEIVEYTINQKAEAMLGDLYQRDPQVIAFSCYIWNWTVIQELITELPKLLPDTALWLGGPEVSYDAPEILRRYPQITGIMIGEGEETFSELMHYYCGGREAGDTLLQIAGLCLPESGMTGKRGLTELDRIPFFYQDLAQFENRILYYESSRGCPFRCSYCLSSIDKQVRLRSLSRVKQELQFFLEHRVPQVKFVDRTFNCNHTHAEEIWRYLMEHDNGVTNFHFEISADLLTEKELEILGRMRPGLVQLEIGVQSTNLRTIQEIRRSMELSRLEAAVARLRGGKNIHIHLDLIAGLPYENYDSFVTSFERVYQMQPDQLQLGFLKVLKGSYLHEKAKEYGIYYRSLPPYEVLYSKWLTYEELLRLKRIEEMVELYYNSHQFPQTIRLLERAFAGAFFLYEALAAYYEEKGYLLKEPARARRYEILLEFACRQEPEWEALYREALTYDLYLRENCKSRPEFAKDLTPYRERLRKNGRDRREHTEVFDYPVWEAVPEKMRERRKEPLFVRFCYEERDPLSGNARTCVEEEA